MFHNFEMSSTRFSTVSIFSRLVFTSNSRYRSHSQHRLFNKSSVSASMSPITPKELNITIHRSSLITPLTDRKTMFLSNMDLILNNLPFGSILFFSNHQDFPIETIVDTLESAFRKVLVTYDYVAGRLKTDRGGRPEIDCNSAGAGFIVASSDLSLEELGDLASSNPDYQKLAVTQQFNGSHVNDHPLLNLQITSFKCGAFSLGCSFNHMLFDGIGYEIFLQNLASLARNHSLSLAPVNNRQLLSARSPLQTSFPHPEFFKLNIQLKGYKPILSSCLPSTNNTQTKTFHLSATDILNLKDKAKMNDEGNDNINLKFITDFNVVLTHIWRCIGLTKNTGNEQENPFSIIFPYNIRHRLRPRLPTSYAGNAVYFLQSTTTFNDLAVGPFSRLVQTIAQAPSHLTEEYVRSAIDCIELHSGSLITDALVTSWWKLGFLNILYPWGKPKWNFPVLDNEVVNIIFILPDIEGTGSNHGCNIVVSLQPKEMEKFQGFFDRFLGRI